MSSYWRCKTRDRLNVAISLYVINSGPSSAAENMAMDEALLQAMPRLEIPILRFYGWTEKAASFGYFQRFAEVERWTLLRPLVRRPTGGGLVPHDSDWTYSLAFPAPHPWYHLRAAESYRHAHEWIQAAFARLNVPTQLARSAHHAEPGQCFVGHEVSDVLWKGRKLAGAAQRRTKAGLLIQGSVQPLPSPLQRLEWEAAMLEVSPLGAASQLVPDEPLLDVLDRLAREKYSRAEYNRKR